MLDNINIISSIYLTKVYLISDAVLIFLNSLNLMIIFHFFQTRFTFGFLSFYITR